jgi:hypothetical protein
MKRYLIAGLVASACLFAASTANAAPLIAHDLSLDSPAAAIQVKGGHGHGRGHGWHGHRGRHLGWHRGHHRGWGHSRHRHWR